MHAVEQFKPCNVWVEVREIPQAMRTTQTNSSGNPVKSDGMEVHSPRMARRNESPQRQKSIFSWSRSTNVSSEGEIEHTLVLNEPLSISQTNALTPQPSKNTVKSTATLLMTEGRDLVFTV